jgi:hypothetical protein
MKQKKLVIKIKKPLGEVFLFLLNPKNTPLWVDSIKEEKVDKLPVKAGTIFKNRGSQGGWSSYKITSFKKNKFFTFSSLETSYHVKYSFKSLGKNLCQITYFEWMDKGELKHPFSILELEKLKKVLEERHE